MCVCEREGVGERDGEVRGDGLSRVLVKDVRLEGGALVCGIFEWRLLHMV